MEKAPIPENESKRLASLHALYLLDTPAEERFDIFTRVATRLFNVPISTLTLVDAHREWFKSCQGLSETRGERAISFCGHALVENEMLVVEDTKKDKRFFDNPMVVKSPHIRFYAGVPIMSADGQRVGVFCIKGTKPRKFSKEDREILKQLAKLVEHQVNAHNLSSMLKEQKGIIDENKLKQRRAQ